MEYNSNIYVVISFELYNSNNMNTGRINVDETLVILTYFNESEIPTFINNNYIHKLNHQQALEFVCNNNW